MSPTTICRIERVAPVDGRRGVPNDANFPATVWAIAQKAG
jgi:hypothetical protein